MVLAAVLSLLATAIYVCADPVPTNPAPGDLFIQGQSCPIGWNVDPTGIWTTMNIDLMTGNNFEMVFLTNVATVDGTNPSKTTFSFPCPQVTPYSAIYFYQFSSPSAPNKTWTGRFTITDSANDVVPPAQSTQPDGSKIPWGTGSLVNGTSAAASGSPAGVSATPATSVSASSSAFSIAPSSASSNSSSPSVVYLTSTATATATASASTALGTASSTGSNGAVAAFAPSTVLFQTGLALGLTVVGFAAMF